MALGVRRRQAHRPARDRRLRRGLADPARLWLSYLDARGRGGFMAEGGKTTSATFSATADGDALQRCADGSGRSRSPRWQPIRERDRVFINEYLQFGYMHHVIAAEALRSAYERADAVATRMREQVERVDRPTATAIAARLNDGARVQTVVVARLLSEFASAIED